MAWCIVKFKSESKHVQ